MIGSTSAQAEDSVASATIRMHNDTATEAMYLLQMVRLFGVSPPTVSQIVAAHFSGQIRARERR